MLARFVREVSNCIDQKYGRDTGKVAECFGVTWKGEYRAWVLAGGLAHKRVLCTMIGTGFRPALIPLQIVHRFCAEI